MIGRVRPHCLALLLVLLVGWTLKASAHQDPCHRLHRCPSHGHTYVCGDKGRCD
jgi:hypothetical protein